jgi:hypothetical protein
VTAQSITPMAALAAAALLAAGCNDSPTSTDGTTLTDATTLAAKAGGVGPGGICRGEDGTPLPTAPRDARVDLDKPAFSDPTHVTNPLFPVSSQGRVLLLGHADGLPLRIEVTLLANRRVIDVRPRPVETLVSQFVAFLDGRIHEVAVDHYAQADDGAVWYFGEDVFNYEDGVVADNEGTWLAGVDGGPAMIMPADPQVGDVWRPENICGLVFEEVTATATDVTVTGPRGPIPGALMVEELHMDGVLEPKTFAPGYGEFTSGSAAGDLEALALAVPPDALQSPTPAELETLFSGATEIFDAAQSGDWPTASATLGTMTTAWNTFQAGAGDVPPLLQAQMDGALAVLVAAVGAQGAAARQAAIDVARASLDLQLRHRTVVEVDLALLDLWARQLLIDIAAGDQGAILGDITTIQWIRDRLAGEVSDAELARVDARLGDLVAAGQRGRLAQAMTATANLRSTLAQTRARAQLR